MYSDYTNGFEYNNTLSAETGSTAGMKTGLGPTIGPIVSLLITDASSVRLCPSVRSFMDKDS
jgi:hypothetical protein